MDKNVNINKIKELIKRGAEIDHIDPRDGDTPLIVLISNDEGGDYNTIKQFLELCVDLNFNSSPIQPIPNALHAGVRRGDIDILKLLISKGLDINIGRGEDTSYPISCVSYEGDSGDPEFIPINIVNFLLENGFDVNWKDSHGNTPFFTLLEFFEYDECKEILKTLIYYGVDIEHKNNKGEDMYFFHLLHRNNVNSLKKFVEENYDPKIKPAKR